MIQENKTVYYDAEMPANECPSPDPNNFVKMINVRTDAKGTKVRFVLFAIEGQTIFGVLVAEKRLRFDFLTLALTV